MLSGAKTDTSQSHFAGYSLNVKYSPIRALDAGSLCLRFYRAVIDCEFLKIGENREREF